MKKLYTLGLLNLILILSCHGQYQWRKKACLPSWGRRCSANFASGGKGYVVGGANNSIVATSEVWCYDPSTNIWVQKGNFPRTLSSGCVFIINDTAYVGLGEDSVHAFHTDFYKYNAGSDSWTSIAPFSGSGRYGAMAFALNGVGYAGTGFDGAILADLYAYDPSANVWVQKNNFPTTRENASGVAIGNTGVAGLGYTGGGTMDSDIYTYDPIADSWTQVASLPAPPRNSACSFVLNDTLYIAGGSNAPLDYADCWRYNVAGNTWTQMQGFGTIAHSRAENWAFVLNGHAYIPGGDSDQVTHFNDLLEFGIADNSFITVGDFLGNDTTYTGSFTRTFSTGVSNTIWSTGQTGSQITVSSPGLYWAIYNDSCGMMTDSIALTEKPLGLGDLTESNDVKIWPNPASGYCTISMNDLSQENYTAYLFDISGRELCCLGKITNGKLTFGVSSFDKGLYFLHIISGKDYIRTKTLVID